MNSHPVRRSSIGIAFAVAFVAGFAFEAKQVRAFWIRKSAVECFPRFLDCSGGDCLYMNSDGIYNPSNEDYAEFICPVLDTSEFPKANIRRLNVHGRDDSDDASAEAHVCVTLRNEGGGDGEVC